MFQHHGNASRRNSNSCDEIEPAEQVPGMWELLISHPGGRVTAFFFLKKKYFYLPALITPHPHPTSFYSGTNKIESDPENTEHMTAFFHWPCEPGGSFVLANLCPDRISEGTNHHRSAETSEGFSSVTWFIIIALSTGPGSAGTHLLFHCLSSKAVGEC